MLGSPIAHSLSPVLHRAAYTSLGLQGWTYEAVEVADAAQLRTMIEGCDDSWSGLSLTMPLKRLVQPMLTSQSALAVATRSINTVVFDADGPHGHNTDVHGMVMALREAGCGPSRGGPAVILGGGATAASAVAALARLGHPAVSVVVRSPGSAAEVTAVGAALEVAVHVAAWADAPALLARAEVAVSTLPAVAAQAVGAAVRQGGTHGGVGGLLLDVVYDPWPSAPVQAWRHAGGTAAGGFAMLLHQAVEQVRLMTGRTPDAQAMRTAGLSALRC